MQYKNLSYLHKVQEIPEITAVLSNTWSGTDGLMDNSAIQKQLEQLFPKSEVNIIMLEWLPHVNVTQAAWLHAKILEDYKEKNSNM
jgi:hypothetical protein